MEYVYAILLLNEAGRELDETNVTAVLEAAGTTVSGSRVRGLVAALEGVDVDHVVPELDVVVAADAAVDADRPTAVSESPSDVEGGG